MDFLKGLFDLFKDPSVQRTVGKTVSKYATPETLKKAAWVVGGLATLTVAYKTAKYVKVRHLDRKRAKEEMKTDSYQRNLEEAIKQHYDSADYVKMKKGIKDGILEDNEGNVCVGSFLNNQCLLSAVIQYETIDSELARELRNNKGKWLEL